MKVQYIKHSGFLVEFEKVAFVFDYYEGAFDLPDCKKHLYFFVSHKHADHFSFAIFEYAKKYPHITFVLSNDIKMNEAYMNRKGVCQEAREHIVYAHKNQTFSLDLGLQVETLTSTDEGVAYIITYREEEKPPASIYHAGDLNWWTWLGETQEEYEDMTKRFQTEMKKLDGRMFDLAFVPLDPRQEERFYWGLDCFARTAAAKRIVPMHCWEDYSVIPKLKELEEAKPYVSNIVDVHHCGEWLKF